MKKSHRIALKPTPEQEALFGQHAGYARFAYNWAVSEFRAGLDVGEWLNERTLRPRWNKVKGVIAPWGSELSQNAAKYAIIDLGQAAEGWGEYCRRVKAGQRPSRRVGFPRFKRRKHEQGFRADNGPDTVKVAGKIVILPKIGQVATVEQLRFAGSIREVTVNRTADTWFACCCVEDGQEPPPVKDGPTIGVDVGVGTMATCSDGTTVENPRALANGLKQLRRLDKAIARSRNVHGRSNHSNRRERLYANRRRRHARVVNVRNDNHHKATTAIAKSAGRVVVETLNVAGMVRNRRLARAIADAGMSGFLARLDYKCGWYGAEYVKADRWYASSKLCAHCGWKNDDLTLSDREWWCSGCGILNNRDANAAMNLANWPGLSFPVSGRGDRVRPAMPAVVGEASNEPGETSTQRGVSDFIRF
jgi:putative transposase